MEYSGMAAQADPAAYAMTPVTPGTPATDAAQATYMQSLAQWQSVMQDWFKNAQAPGQPAPQFSNLAASYAGLWGSQPAMAMAAYGAVPFYGGMFPTPYPGTPAPGVPEVSVAAPSQGPVIHNGHAAGRPPGSSKDAPDDQHEPKHTHSTEEQKPGVPVAVPAVMQPAVPVMSTPVSTSTSGDPAPVRAYPASTDYWRNPSATAAATLSSGGMDHSAYVPGDDREVKRQRRKQSNRESARRSRLRKQAESEILAKSVRDLSTENDDLKDENVALRSQIEKLRADNAKLVAKVRELGGSQDDDKPDKAPVPMDAEPVQMTDTSKPIFNSEAAHMHAMGSQPVPAHLLQIPPMPMPMPMATTSQPPQLPHPALASMPLVQHHPPQQLMTSLPSAEPLQHTASAQQLSGMHQVAAPPLPPALPQADGSSQPQPMDHAPQALQMTPQMAAALPHMLQHPMMPPGSQQPHVLLPQQPLGMQPQQPHMPHAAAIHHVTGAPNNPHMPPHDPNAAAASLMHSAYPAMMSIPGMPMAGMPGFPVPGMPMAGMMMPAMTVQGMHMAYPHLMHDPATAAAYHQHYGIAAAAAADHTAMTGAVVHAEPHSMTNSSGMTNPAAVLPHPALPAPVPAAPVPNPAAMHTGMPAASIHMPAPVQPMPAPAMPAPATPAPTPLPLNSHTPLSLPAAPMPAPGAHVTQPHVAASSSPAAMPSSHAASIPLPIMSAMPLAQVAASSGLPPAQMAASSGLVLPAAAMHQANSTAASPMPLPALPSLHLGAMPAPRLPATLPIMHPDLPGLPSANPGSISANVAANSFSLPVSEHSMAGVAIVGAHPATASVPGMATGSPPVMDMPYAAVTATSPPKLTPFPSLSPSTSPAPGSAPPASSLACPSTSSHPATTSTSNGNNPLMQLPSPPPPEPSTLQHSQHTNPSHSLLISQLPTVSVSMVTNPSQVTSSVTSDSAAAPSIIKQEPSEAAVSSTPAPVSDEQAAKTAESGIAGSRQASVDAAPLVTRGSLAITLEGSAEGAAGSAM